MHISDMHALKIYYGGSQASTAIKTHICVCIYERDRERECVERESLERVAGEKKWVKERLSERESENWPK